jgi:hypothetical protein
MGENGSRQALSLLPPNRCILSPRRSNEEEGWEKRDEKFLGVVKTAPFPHGCIGEDGCPRRAAKPSMTLRCPHYLFSHPIRSIFSAFRVAVTTRAKILVEVSVVF